MMDYKPIPQTCDSSSSLLNELNNIFTQFKAVLRDYAEDLMEIFTDMFKISLSQAAFPICFKATSTYIHSALRYLDSWDTYC